MCHPPSIPPSPPISSAWALPCFLQSRRGSSSGEHSLQLLLPQLPHPLHWHTVHVEVVTQQCLRLLPAMYTVDTIHQWTVKERPHTSATTLGKAFTFQRRAHLSHLTSHTSFLHPWYPHPQATPRCYLAPMAGWLADWPVSFHTQIHPQSYMQVTFPKLFPQYQE